MTPLEIQIFEATIRTALIVGSIAGYFACLTVVAVHTMIKDKAKNKVLDEIEQFDIKKRSAKDLKIFVLNRLGKR